MAVAAVALAVLTMLPTGIAVASPAGSAPTNPLTLASTVAGSDASPTEIGMAPAYSPGVGVATLGPLPTTTPIDVAVGLAPRDPSGLAALIAAESTPGDAAFHHPLSASAAAQAFGATPSAVAAATAYFAGFGLTVVRNPDGLLLDVIGPSGTVGRAFGTTFEEYRSPDGTAFWSHPTPASLPSVAPWTGVFGLDNLTVATPNVQLAGASSVTPATGCSGGSGGLLPCAIEGAYNISSVLSAGNNGTGVRIAVVDAYSGDDPQHQLATDLASFEVANGLPTTGVSFLYPVPYSGLLNSSSTNPAWGLEDSLDIEWARAVAPGASLEMTFSPNSGAGLYEAIDWLVGHDAADVISLSWGEPDVGQYNAYDTPCSAACNASTDGTYAILGPVLELAAVEGITVFAASGDCGAADGTSGLATNFPASDPYVTGVGGTVLTLSGADVNSWFDETGWNGNASGATSPGCENQGGSGGGYSPLPRPYWQVGLPSSPKGRGVPDVAMDADTAVQIEYFGNAVAVIGTSVGTPIWAGIAALGDAYAGGDLGLLDPSIYRILNTPSEYASDFHDITVGNNGYAAGVGWDPVTGVGTPRVDALLPDLTRGGAAAGGSLAVSLSVTPSSGAAPLPVTFTVTPSGGSGTYSLYGVAFGNGNASLATSSTVAYTYPVAGVYTAQAFVYDSGGNASASAPITVVVGGGHALTVSLVVSDTSPAEASSVNFTATVGGGTGPYLYNFSFGDGAYTVNGTAAEVAHTFCSVGTFDAYVTARDSADPVDGGESAPVVVTVSNASGPACARAPVPLELTPWTNLTVRDAPADFPGLFSVTGGTGSSTVALASSDPYTSACDCAILETPGNYTVTGVATDVVGRTANASVNVTVAPPLVGEFSSSALAGRVPLTVDLGLTVTGGFDAEVSAAVWTSGTGTTVTGATAAFSYTTPGEYLAEGVLSDRGDGNVSEAFVIDAEPASGAVPLGATATIAPAANVSSGATVSVSATAIGASASSVLLWRLPGGGTAYGPTANESVVATSLGAVPSGDQETAQLVILGSGDVDEFAYTAVLDGFFAIEPGGFVPAVSALTMASSLSREVGSAPFSTTGTGAAFGPGFPAVSWSFGGGTLLAETEGTVTYTFESPGNFTAQAYASDPPFDDSLVESTAVQVAGPLAMTASLSSLDGTAPLTISGHATATGGIGAPYVFDWFCNGLPVGGGNGTMNCTFGSAGTFPVTVEAYSGGIPLAHAAWNVSVVVSTTFPLVVLAGGVGVGLVLAVVVGRAGRRARPPTP